MSTLTWPLKYASSGGELNIFPYRKSNCWEQASSMFGRGFFTLVVRQVTEALRFFLPIKVAIIGKKAKSF